MTRIRVLQREELNDEQGRVFDAAKTAGEPTGGPYWAYIRNPTFMRLSQEMGKCLRDSALSARERQIAVLTVIRYWDAQYPWAVQVRRSLAAGLDQPIIDAINARQVPKLASPREALAHQIAGELMAKHGMSDATYRAAEKEFKIEDLVALVAVIGYFSMVSNTANAFDITPPEDAPARLK